MTQNLNIKLPKKKMIKISKKDKNLLTFKSI